MRFIGILVLVASGGLAACGGGGGGTTTGSGEIDLAGVQAMSNRLVSLSNTEGSTAYAALPSSGTARYDGYAVVDYSPDGDATNGLLGEAALRADFGSGAISGQLDNFHRVTDSYGIGRLYDGALTVSGDIYSSSGWAGIDGRVRGTLDGGNDVVTIDNDLIGEFVGDDHDAIALMNGYGSDTMTRNGSSAPVGIYVMGER